jgi:hypothetical protein
MAEGSPHHRADVVVTSADGSVTLKVPDGGVTLTENEALELAGRLVEAQARAGGEDPAENDWVRVPMQYIRAAAERMEVEGADESPEEDELQGAKSAEVHCWIANQTQRNAMHIAAGSVAEHGWVVTEVIEQAPVMRTDFEGTDYLPYYEQALTDSEVFLYEIDEPETDETEGSADAS